MNKLKGFGEIKRVEVIKMQNLLNDLKAVLEKDDRLIAEGQLLKNKIIELALAMDGGLIRLLLTHDGIKKHFFTDVEGVLVFDKAKFQQFVSNKAFLPDSFTAFKNKIGLTVDSQYLTDSKEVVLAWPYKDCVLEGGQTKEDAKRDEIFWNETLAPDQIDRLLAPKALTYFKKYDKDGEHDVKGIDQKDNLIIKGNNLLALHTLKSAYAGRVKLIYIDPPYNTGSDGFKYNDNFNESTWLTFMRNRLEIAKVLLHCDGVIFVSADDNEYAHLKVLMDEIFGKEQFENIFHVRVRHEERILRKDIRYQKVVEQMLCYSKSSTYFPARIFKENEDLEDQYVFNIEIKNNAAPKIETIAGYTVEVYSKEQYILNKTSAGNFKEYNIRGALITQKGSASEFYEFNLKNRRDADGLGTLYKVIGMGERGDGLGYRYIRQPDKLSGKNGFYYQGKPLKKTENIGNPYPNFWDMEPAFNNCAEEGGIKLPNGKKPEAFIYKIFELSNLKRGELVLDFFLGSGTTAAVAHKFGAQYIGIDQMDYIQEKAIVRLRNVIKGDGTGISKTINWQGGGSFVYCELARANQSFVDRIQSAKTTKELQDIWADMQDTAFLSYRIDPKTIDLKGQDFNALNLDDQKRFLIEVMDKNMLYVPYSEMDDKTYGVSDTDKKLNRQFQGKA